MKTRLAAAAVLSLVLLPSAAGTEEGLVEEHKNVVGLDPGTGWNVLSIFSGKVNYYGVGEEDGQKFIRSRYDPDLKTVILYRRLGKPCPCYKISWRWRVHSFPDGADELSSSKSDSPAAVYVYFRKPLRQYVIKYIWSVAYPKGFSYRSSKSNFFNRMHVKVVEGPPTEKDVWKRVTVDAEADFRKYFLDDDEQNDPIPEVWGVGILTDGDATKKIVETDYADFSLSEK
ncbi:MAG: DUF3047 domain-containing protein [Myxococcota bacterium]